MPQKNRPTLAPKEQVRAELTKSNGSTDSAPFLEDDTGVKFEPVHVRHHVGHFGAKQRIDRPHKARVRSSRQKHHDLSARKASPTSAAAHLTPVVK